MLVPVFWLWLAPPQIETLLSARGHNVAIRPAGEHSLVLVDGLTPAALERMDPALSAA